jgi:hypothetical protein
MVVEDGSRDEMIRESDKAIPFSRNVVNIKHDGHSWWWEGEGEV